MVNPQATLNDNDAILFLNFRADRARELTQALTFNDFQGFKRKHRVITNYFASITNYGAQFPNPVMFDRQAINNGLGEFLASQGLSQLRIAETEKYPHVTYFFSGGREEPYIGEERILISSPKVTTYDLQPEMSALGITENIIDSLNNHRHDVIICNFANGDMVGHTGSLSAAITAVETIDSCVARVVEAAQTVGGEVIITADHGNCEHMYDEQNQQPHTQHTTEPVPFIYIGRPATIMSGGALKDVAPSLLAVLGLNPPPEMTGHNLIQFKTL